MADGAPWWPSLDRALLQAYAKPDTLTALLAGTMHLMIALRARGLGERAAELLPVALEFGLVG